MKFTDLINEDFTPNEEQLKELKRAKMVYTTFRKGALIFMHHSRKDRKDEDNTVKYKLGEPEYNWYTDTGRETDMYLSVVVKNLTVYIKDPVLYDAIVVNPNRMQDYYGPLIYNYIIPKARRKFEKHKVKLHIGEPIVEFVLVEPEEPQAINEGELTDKDNKKIRTLYSTLKRGKVKVSEVEGEDSIFAYKLSDEYEAYSKDGELFISPAGVKIKEMNKAASNSNFTKVFKSLEKRFNNYRINFVKPPMTWDDLISYSFEDAAAGEAINEELSDKDIKKCKILWDQFKTGTFTINDKKYRYQLKNEHQIISVPSNPHPIIEIQGTFDKSVRVYEMQDNGHNILLHYEINNRLYMDVKSKVRNKFNNYNVHLSL